MLGEACLRANTHRQAKHTPTKKSIDGFVPLNPSYLANEKAELRPTKVATRFE